MTGIERYRAFKAIKQSVIDELAGFCCANYSTMVTVDGKIDKDHMMMQEGRRQVYLFIMACRQEPKPEPEQREDTE